MQDHKENSTSLKICHYIFKIQKQRVSYLRDHKMKELC